MTNGFSSLRFFTCKRLSGTGLSFVLVLRKVIEAQPPASLSVVPRIQSCYARGLGKLCVPICGDRIPDS
jgi:hypothetical protein